MHSVKLDTQGRVIGLATGPARPGWLPAPDGEHDPANLRHDGHRWRRLTDAERRQRDLDHAPTAPAEHPRVSRLRALKGKKQLTNDELHQAVLDLIEEV